MGNKYRAPDGSVVTLEGNDAVAAVKSGYTPVDGTVPVAMPRGTAGTVTPEQLAGDDSLSGQDVRVAHERAAALENEQLHNSPEHASRALGQGILAPLTFGTSDFAFDDAAELAAARPGFRLGGEITGAVGSLGQFGGLGAKLGGGAAARVGATVLEGFGQGVGQGVSNIALRDPDAAAEAVLPELLKQGVFGAGFGLGGGLLGEGMSGLGGKLAGMGKKPLPPTTLSGSIEGTLGADAVSKGVEKLDTALEKAAADSEFAANNYRWYNDHPELKQPAGRIQKFDADLNGLADETEAAVRAQAEKIRGQVQPAADTAPGAAKLAADQAEPLPSETMVRSFRLSRQWLDDTTQHVTELAATGGVKDLAAAKKMVAKAKRLRGELGELSADGADALGRPTPGKVRGNAGIKAMPLEDQRALAKKLVEYRNLGREMESQFGGPGLGIAEPADEVLALEHFAAGKNWKKADGAWDADLAAEAAFDAHGAKNAEQLAKAKALEDAADQLRASRKPLDLDALGSDQLASGTVLSNYDELATSLRGAAGATDTKLLQKVEKHLGRLEEVSNDLAAVAGKAPAIGDLATVTALKEAQAARQLIATQLPNGTGFDAIAQMSPDHALPLLNSMNDYYKAVKSLGNTSPEFKQALLEFKDAVGGAAKGMPNDMSAAQILRDMGVDGIQDFDGPVDDLAKLWIAQAAKVDGKTGKSMLQGMLENATRSAGARGGSKLVRNAVGGAAAGAAANILAGSVGGAVGVGIANAAINAVAGNAGRLLERVGDATSRIARATGRLAQKGAPATRAIAPVASAVLNAVSFGPDKPKKQDMQAAFKSRFEELAQVVADPMGTQYRVNQNLKDMRKASLPAADTAEMAAMNVAQKLFDEAPKDPGNMTRFGKSRWKPTDAEIVKWASYMRGALDPLGVYERAVDGGLTPQEAKAVRELYPATFAQIQQQIAIDLPTIRENSTYDQRTRLTILFGVPVDSHAAKHNVDFVQQQFAERAGPDSEPVDLNAEAFKNNEPTETQKL